MLGILFVSVVVGVISVARLFSMVIVQFCFLVLHQYLVLVSKSRELGPLHMDTMDIMDTTDTD